jgi:Icc-related predicted phosphoesterase
MRLRSSPRNASAGRRGDRSAASTASLYYSSDIHGSERLWRKFLKAASFYSSDALIMGGDLTGKALVPIFRSEDGRTHEAQFLGERRSASSPKQLEELLESIRFNGMYPWIGTAQQISEHQSDEELRCHLIDRVLADEMRRWVELADERLANSPAKAYVMAGNDDPWFIDPILEESRYLSACDDRVVMVGTHEMLSSSYANRTPWDSHRELDEDDLYQRLRSLAEQLERPRSAIFNLHAPPYASGLDLATKIDGEFKVVLEGGQVAGMPVGSTAVRQLIEEYQPVLALHGHIHESRAEAYIGETLTLNPGSEYNRGRIHGVVVRMCETSVSSHQFVVG